MVEKKEKKSEEEDPGPMSMKVIFKQPDPADINLQNSSHPTKIKELANINDMKANNKIKQQNH